MRPIAFYNGQVHADVYAMTRREFLDMTNDHLRDAHKINTEFTSWSASLNFARNYAATKAHGDAYISIIDTERLCKQNKIWYIPKLYELTRLRPCPDVFNCEYLVHGIITGPAYRAAKFADFRSLGIKEYAPSYTEEYWSEAGILTSKVLPIDQPEVLALKKIARCYGKGLFSMAMFIALICLQRRSSDLWKDKEVPLEFVDLLLRNFSIDSKKAGWGSSNKIMSDIALVDSYQDVQQMVRLMRAIYSRQHPSQAKTQNRCSDTTTVAASGRQKHGHSESISAAVDDTEQHLTRLDI